MKSYARSFLSGRAANGDITGSLSIAVASSPYEGEAIPKRCFADFQEKYPKVTLSLNYESEGSCLLSFLEGACDALIARSRYSEGVFWCTKLFDLPLHAIVSKDHPLSWKETVSLTEICGYPVAKPYDLGLSHSIVDNRFKEKGLSPEYEKTMVFMDEYDHFIHERQGVGFVIYSPHMETLYPDVTFLPLGRDDVIEIPICLISKQESEPLALLQQYLLVTHTRETRAR